MTRVSAPSPAKPPARLLAGFAAASLVAVICGAVTMASVGTPTLRWALTLAAWGIGALMALALFRARPRGRVWPVVAIVGTGAIIATLAGPDQSGVQRWLQAGPLSIHVAGVVLPALIVALARLGADSRLAQAAALVVAAVLALQPDASQAWAFALAGLAWLLPDRTPSVQVQAVVLIALAVLATMRPDPLLPVAEVEQIVGLANTVHPALAALAVTALAALPVLLWSARRGDRAARALALYTAAICVAPMLGWFPVPLVGAGMSFPLGLWLGTALLATGRADG